VNVLCWALRVRLKPDTTYSPASQTVTPIVTMDIMTAALDGYPSLFFTQHLRSNQLGT
jgi:hypothetical protein